MKKRLLALFLCLLFLFPLGSFAQAEDDLVILLIIDQSGSMLDTDPYEYRIASAGLLVDILGHEDQLGLLTFSSEVNVLHDIASVGENRQSFHTSLSNIGDADGNTDYLLALQKARELLLAKASKRCSIVFLTDGDPYPSYEAKDPAFLAEYTKKIDQIVEQLALENCSIYTVGFGDSSGEILEPISTKTHGLSFINTEPSELAGHFFSIVSSLKGREILVEDVLTEEGKNYSFNLDNNTTQLNCLVVGDLFGYLPQLTSPAANLLGSEGVGYSSLILTKEQLEKPNTWELSIPVGNVHVKVARDTKVRLEILSPTIQSEFSEEAPIDLVVRTPESEKDARVEARYLLNGEPHGDWLILEKEEDLYKGAIKGISSAGKHEIEFRAMEEEVVLTSITVPVHIKRIPELHVELHSNQGALVGDSDVTLRAWLTRNDKTLTSNNVQIEEFRLVRGSMESGVEILNLHDDGEEGDLFAGDGIFSARFRLASSGELEGEVQAQGIYGNESFQLSKSLEVMAIEEPGSVEIVLNDNKPFFEGAFKEMIQIPIKLKNLGDYDEVVTVSVDQEGIELNNPLFSLKPKEEQNSVLQIQLEDQSTENIALSFSYSVKNQSTRLSYDKTGIELVRKESSEIRKESFTNFLGKYGIVLFPLILAMIGYGVYRVVSKKKQEKEATTLKGFLHYRKADEAWTSIPLDGSLEEIAIGKVGREVEHQLDGKEIGFILSVRRKPSAHVHHEVGFRIHCGLPGVISLRGVEASSFELAYDENFFCGGYEWVIKERE